MNKLITTGLLAAILVLSEKPALALWGRDLRVAADFETSFLMGGTGGTFENQSFRVQPNLVSLYSNPGLGARIELGYMLDPNWEILGGIGYINFAGGTASMTTPAGDRIDLQIENFNAYPIYIGGRFLFGEEPGKGFTPFIRSDIGAIISQDTNARITFLSASPTTPSWTRDSAWWGQTTSIMWDVGGGVEYRLKNLAFFMEVFYESLGKPSSAVTDSVGGVAYSGSSTTWAPASARLGVSYYF